MRKNGGKPIPQRQRGNWATRIRPQALLDGLWNPAAKAIGDSGKSNEAAPMVVDHLGGIVRPVLAAATPSTRIPRPAIVCVAGSTMLSSSPVGRHSRMSALGAPFAATVKG